ncbi:hypothetical protein [Streptomyces sp. CC224B]|uniref:hypothetical protein n=1 Tax=Streptomyces sp. CC224B TaxID=3044571 RepID=UPI0024A99C29|nr:hypothetical protein [Streptomyces sp. CC224B]
MDMSTGVPGLGAVLVWGGALSLLAGLGAAIWRVVRGFSRLTGRTGQFLDDWYGEERGPGVPARPGVMERLSNLEGALRSVQHEVKPISGASLRDAVDRANERLERLCPGVMEPCDPEAERTEPPAAPPALPPQPKPPNKLPGS